MISIERPFLILNNSAADILIFLPWIVSDLSLPRSSSKGIIVVTLCNVVLTLCHVVLTLFQGRTLLTLYQRCATLKIRRSILFHFQRWINVISTLIHNVETMLIDVEMLTGNKHFLQF